MGNKPQYKSAIDLLSNLRRGHHGGEEVPYTGAKGLLTRHASSLPTSVSICGVTAARAVQCLGFLSRLLLYLESL